uniref:Uncharacterized protein n=1 Tax=Lepeophtheirus salmonis TaxID=72036 RepID=A0A0K2TN18_LEPSM
MGFKMSNFTPRQQVYFLIVGQDILSCLGKYLNERKMEKTKLIPQ